MARVKITLSADRLRALKEAAARRGVTIGELIEASLDLNGIETSESAAKLVAHSRSSSGLSEDEAVGLALSETRATRS